MLDTNFPDAYKAVVLWNHQHAMCIGQGEGEPAAKIHAQANVRIFHTLPHNTSRPLFMSFCAKRCILYCRLALGLFWVDPPTYSSYLLLRMVSGSASSSFIMVRATS